MNPAIDEQELKGILDNFTKGLLNGDKAILESVIAENLSYGHSGGNTENKSEVIEAFVTGKYKFGKMVISDQTIQLFGDTAVVRQKLYATTADLGKTPGEVHLFILTVWKKMNGAWKLITRQAVKNPEFMK